MESKQPLSCKLQVRADGGSWRDPQSVAAMEDLHLGGIEKPGVVTIGGLKADTRYEYRMLDESGRVLQGFHDQSFRTPPTDGTAYDLRVAFGSCAGEWGTDSSQPIFKSIDAQRPDVFLWLGDNTYFTLAEREWEDPRMMSKRWSIARAKPNLQALLAHTVHFAIWDDHDYGPNDSDSTYVHRDESKRMFQRYWPNPMSGLDADDGIYFNFTLGRVEFFMLDTRYERSPNHSPAGPQKVILSPGQWRWLERGLSQSRADFKVVASGMQILSDYHRFETWNLFPSERSRLLDFIAANKIGGVFFISGDRHTGEALRQPVEGSYDLFEFTSSPLAAGIGEATPDAQAPQRIVGTLAAQENFALLDFHFPPSGSPSSSDGPVLSFRLHDVYGRPLGRQVVLRLSELQP